VPITGYAPVYLASSSRLVGSISLRSTVPIDGGCPCMFGPTADPGHKAVRFVLTLTGNVPRRV